MTQKYSPKWWAKGCWLINPMVRIQSKRSHKKIQEVVIAGSVILGHLPKFQAFLDLVASGERMWEWRKIGGWKTTFEVWLQNDVSINLCSFAVHIKWRYQCCTLLCLVQGLPLFAQNSWKNLGPYPDIHDDIRALEKWRPEASPYFQSRSASHESMCFFSPWALKLPPF